MTVVVQEIMKNAQAKQRRPARAYPAADSYKLRTSPESKAFERKKKL